LPLCDLNFGYLPAVGGAHLPSVVLLQLRNDTAEAVNRRPAAALADPDSRVSSGRMSRCFT
jgi:hypothetical protein